MQLKAEQARADRTRDAAWAELKRCIEEVARLSNQACFAASRASYDSSSLSTAYAFQYLVKLVLAVGKACKPVDADDDHGQQSRSKLPPMERRLRSQSCRL